MEEGKIPEESKAPEEKPEEKAPEEKRPEEKAGGPIPPTPPTPPPAAPTPPKKKAKWPIILLVVLLVCCLLTTLGGVAVFYSVRQAAQTGVEQMQEDVEEAVDKAKVEACKANQQALKSALEIYRTSNGRYPASLDVLVEEGLFTGEAECPVDDRQYEYDSSTGEVTCPNGHTID